MNFIFCMAGLYQRFRDQGYNVPKYLLPLQKNKTILEVILDNIIPQYPFENVLLVANKRDAGQRDKLTDIMQSCNNLCKKNVIFIEDTLGQAETAYMGVKYLKNMFSKNSSKVIFHNIDTILTNRDFYFINTALDKYDGFIDVFESNNPAYSYVKVNKDKIVINIAEKIVISNLATSGLYAFKSIDEYISYYEKTSFVGEFYISSIYLAMIKSGKMLTVSHNTNKKSTIILGSPEEYEGFLKKEL